MKEFFRSKKGACFIAAVWTVCTVNWIALCVKRIGDGTGEGLVVMTALTALLGAVCCVLNWVRYARFEESKKETKE